MFIFTVVDLIGLVISGIFLVILAWLHLKNWWKVRKCTHEKVRENMACDTICCNCNKNLGFIGSRVK